VADVNLVEWARDVLENKHYSCSYLNLLVERSGD
jgi:hypothetical protein